MSASTDIDVPVNTKSVRERSTSDAEGSDEIELGSHDTDGSGTETDDGSEYSYNSFLAKSDEEDNLIEEENEDESENECSDEEMDISAGDEISSSSNPQLAKQDRLQVMINRYEAFHALDEEKPTKKRRRENKK